MKEIMRDCRANPNHPNCLEMSKRLRQEYLDLRKICHDDPKDERCGSIMREKKAAGWVLEQQCLENPHETKCVKRRERTLLREKMKRAFCRKNPDAARCLSGTVAKKGANSLKQWCQTNPERQVCKVYAERTNQNKPKEETQTNTF